MISVIKFRASIDTPGGLHGIPVEIRENDQGEVANHLSDLPI